mgnify:CR=1
YPSIILKSMTATLCIGFPAAPSKSLMCSSLFLASIAAFKEGNLHKAKGNILPPLFLTIEPHRAKGSYPTYFLDLHHYL